MCVNCVRNTEKETMKGREEREAEPKEQKKNE